MSKPAAERPLWVHQDRLNLPFPAVQGTALLLKARFLLSGMGRRVKFFSLRKGFFFALLLIFPLWEAKNPARPSQEAGYHKICFYIDPTGLFFTCRTKKITEAPEPPRHAAPATGMPSAQKNFRTASPVCRIGPLARSPPLQGLTGALPCPSRPARTEKLPQAKTIRAGANSMGMFCPCHGAVPPHAGCRDRDPPECDHQRCTILFGSKNARGGLPSREAPLICFMMT